MAVLQIQQKWRWRAMVKITARNLSGHIIDVVEFPNLITTAGFNMMRDGLYGPGGAQDLEISYCGYGDDDSTPLVGDTTLGNEVARKARTSQSKPAAGQQTYVQYIDPTEWVDQIEELGWFAGPGDLSGLDSGILVSHMLYSRNKTGLESLQIERTDSFEEA